MSTPPSDTRPGISEEQLQRLIRAIQEMRGGANVNVTDPRLSKAIVWLLGLIGSTVFIVGGWLITDNISQGRIMERVVTILEQHDKRLDRLEDRKP